jgi:hypothetical protein
MPDNFEGREIVITHEGLWKALEAWGDLRNLSLQRIPFGCDAEGKLTMEVPEGEMAPYAFMPKNV